MLAQVGDSKFCSKCRKLKLLEAFSKSTSVKSGLRPECKSCMSKYLKKRRKTDFNYKLSIVLRSRLSRLVQRGHSSTALRNLGCSPEEFRKYIASQFKEGMRWRNHGKWHLDHILPLSSFDLTDPKQLDKACHYTNLQPLWAIDNLRKSNKLPNMGDGIIDVELSGA